MTATTPAVPPMPSASQPDPAVIPPVPPADLVTVAGESRPAADVLAGGQADTDSIDAELRLALAAIARAPRLLVGCDYDGTLAPIVADPWLVRPLPEGVDALRSLAELTDTTVA